MSESSSGARKLDRETLSKIDVYLEQMYESGKTEETGREISSTGAKNTQIRGLETLVVSTNRFSEIINYIKNQAGKDRKGQWTKFGPRLLEQLDEIENVSRKMSDGDPAKRLDIKLRIARGWIRQVVASYLYSESIGSH
ncbi:MAG TPA: hypothetical protein PLV45_10900 [bacterium]|nr:hypothetical protein [bacterium]